MASATEIMEWAKGWQGACFCGNEPGNVPAESLEWTHESAFDLRKIDQWTEGRYDLLYQESKDDIPEDEDPGDLRYFSEMCEAIKNGTIEEIFVAQGVDRKFYTWDGNHRIGIANVLSVFAMPAFVGYQKVS
jgi:hypothetical protein